MTVTPHLVLGARVVRTAAAALASTTVVGVVALHAFEAEYGAGTTVSVPRADVESHLLPGAVDRQEGLGLTCSRTPVLTDVVLFQPVGGEQIEVITFDEALRQSSAGTGWVRRYCVPAEPAGRP